MTDLDRVSVNTGVNNTMNGIAIYRNFYLYFMNLCTQNMILYITYMYMYIMYA